MRFNCKTAFCVQSSVPELAKARRNSGSKKEIVLRFNTADNNEPQFITRAFQRKLDYLAVILLWNKARGLFISQRQAIIKMKDVYEYDFKI